MKAFCERTLCQGGGPHPFKRKQHHLKPPGGPLETTLHRKVE